MAKKKVPGIYRTTISISADLKRRMDKAGSDVNWSAIAAQAFESKLADIAAKKEVKNMDDVIQRLRASKAKGEGEAYQRGHDAGGQWAKGEAEAQELTRLESLRDSTGQHWQWYFDSTVTHSSDSPAARLVFGMRPDEQGDDHAVSGFWEDVLGDDVHQTEEDEFVRGFADGALEVWDSVKGQL